MSDDESKRQGFLSDPTGALSSGRLAKLAFAAAAIGLAIAGLIMSKDASAYVGIFVGAAIGAEITQKVTGK